MLTPPYNSVVSTAGFSTALCIDCTLKPTKVNNFSSSQKVLNTSFFRNTRFSRADIFSYSRRLQMPTVMTRYRWGQILRPVCAND